MASEEVDSDVKDRTSVEGITFDFYNTLVRHRDGRGRGRNLLEYLKSHGYQPDPWEHRVLYRLFERHPLVDHRFNLTESLRSPYLVRLASGVFSELGIEVSEGEAAEHAEQLWAILGPSSFRVFPDVFSTLEFLKARGIRLAVISNWQLGLQHFLSELNLAPYFAHVVCSADDGVAKPDVRLFATAISRLGIPPARVLHVGDSWEDDYRGARAAGLRSVLLDRASRNIEEAEAVIQSLSDLCRLPEFTRDGIDQAT